MQSTYDVIVIGAGLSGRLPCAAYLQKAGLEVLLLEANSEAEDMSTMTAPELCERTFESDGARQILLTPVAFHEHGAPFARGQGVCRTGCRSTGCTCRTGSGRWG